MDAHSLPHLLPRLLPRCRLHHARNTRILHFLNPQKEHARLAGWIVGIGVAGVIIFFITRTMCVLRNRFFARWARRRGHPEGESIHSEQLDDWETVERPGSTLITASAV
ncbi:hypothetical protein SCHPADRAFT_679580 [Schizopora paradoxa]|uniref:Uncharacterized protein n=1 Tax=Schizopora paradoxa TaxID=27342 RepID=A0A0H2R4K1_9AGAM|nr:hypothetical protein SCHPADRAFT_679580 [Schizopora paradoxa]